MKICPEGYVSVHKDRFDNECITFTEYQQRHDMSSTEGAYVGIGIIVVFLLAFAIFYIVIKPFAD